MITNTLIQETFITSSTNTTSHTTSYPLQLVDGHGRNVTFEEEPQSIVSIAPSVTEIIYAVGAGSKLIAVDFSSNYPNNTDSLDKIGTFPSLDIETLLVYNPDVVLGADITSPDDITTLENQGIKVFILAPFTIDEVLQDIETVGLITNYNDEAAALKANLETRLEIVKQEALNFTYKPKIYLEFFVDPLYTFGPGTYGHNLIELAGGVNIAENATTLYPQIDNEFVITQNPDIIFFAQGPWTITNASIISNRTGWEAIAAIKNNMVYSINEDWLSRGAPRILDALEHIHSKTRLIGSADTTATNIIAGFSWIQIFTLIPVMAIFLLKYRKKRLNP
jgi:iron complex transport system substrate-binding protein